MEQSPKLCKDCKHKDRLDNVCRRPLPNGFNLVVGSYARVNSEDCLIERYGHPLPGNDGIDICGEEGKYFEPK